MGPEVGASVHDGHTGNVQEHPGKGGYVRPSVHIPLGLEISDHKQVAFFRYVWNPGHTELNHLDYLAGYRCFC